MIIYSKQLLILFCLSLICLSRVVALDEIQPELIDRFNETNYVPVIIALLDLSNVSFTPSLSNDVLEARSIIKKSLVSQAQTDLLNLLGDDFHLRWRFPLTYEFSGRLNKAGMNKIKNLPQVKSIMYDSPNAGGGGLSESGPIIGSNLVHNLTFNGTGITVCVVDTGLNYSNPYLGGCSYPYNSSNCSKIINGSDFVNGDYDPYDDQGHGSSVAGIIISQNSVYRGIAPGAKIAAVKVLDENNRWINKGDVVMGIQWCIDNRVKYNISIITVSIQSDQIYASKTICDSTGQTTINDAVSKGIFVDSITGNHRSHTGITWPGCLENVTAVGSSYDYAGQFSGCGKNEITSVDTISCFTNRNDLMDLLAPGAMITTTNRTSLFVTVFGTSFAAPHVAGAAAILQSAYGGSLTAVQVETALKLSGKPIWDSVTNRYYPRIDIKNAFDSILYLDVLNETWPTFHHDNRRTGFTFLKGDLFGDNLNEGFRYLDFNVSSDHFDSPVIGNLVNNKMWWDKAEPQELVVGTFGNDSNNTNGRVYSLKKSYNGTDVAFMDMYWAFSGDGRHVLRSPVIADLNNDGVNEVVFSSYNKTFAVNYDGSLRWFVNFSNPGFSAINGSGQWNVEAFDVDVQGIAIGDLQGDGSKEIVMTDYANVDVLVNWTPSIYVYNETNGQPVRVCNVSIGGSNQKRGVNDHLSLADLNGDDVFSEHNSFGGMTKCF